MCNVTRRPQSGCCHGLIRSIFVKLNPAFPNSSPANAGGFYNHIIKSLEEILPCVSD
jgi:hypothetical protein